jgi:large subunit ribosomal protein L29
VKARDIRDLDDTELGAKQREAREQLFRLRFQIQMGQTDGVKKYRVLRKDLARILTEQRGRELAGRS